MKAYAIDAYKAPVTLHELPEPVARAGEVVVSIVAASMNPIDVKVRSGAFKATLPDEMPLVLGHDLAGTIAAVGAGVMQAKVGDAVFACAGGDKIGTFAERIVIAEKTSPQIASLVESGVIHPVVDQVFLFDQAPAALDRSATGRALGKIVVQGYQSNKPEQGA